MPAYRFLIVYLHKKSDDEDSVLLPKSVLQSVEQSAVPVNQMELRTDRGMTEHKMYLRGQQVEGTVGSEGVRNHQLGLTEGFLHRLLCQV